ncbi:protein-tyrosine phosphatase-like protein [Mycena alexandri]|uniref:protein-tyrosine-phosphatase n=1 Tax=Mycena alexandri TaxID=1745969 RepID=A0AAD6SR55_9AGAR|nr:protein-tyrosine phosphatase-like protein [Mycena alexandri]
MITFEGLSQEEMEAMCTPMHRVLSPAPTSKSHSQSTPASTTTPTSTSTKGSAAPASTGALYLGSMAAVHDTELLRTHHITHLVQVLEVPWIPQSDADGFACHRIDIEDRSSAALQQHLAPACDYIRASLARGDNVLVHCQQGVSRSASIVIAYLIRDRAMSYDAAFDLVKQRRQCIQPNSGFVKTLREWESTCTSTSTPRPRSAPASR